MATSSMIIPQAGQTVIVRNRPALVRSVDERAHPALEYEWTGLQC